MDDLELAATGFLLKHASEYTRIVYISLTTSDLKEPLFKANLKILKERVPHLEYWNLEFPSRSLGNVFDKAKDQIYRKLDWLSPFDILTHDREDCHTDHVFTASIMFGAFKYASKYVTVYSPSTVNFAANYWVGLTSTMYQIKKTCANRYDLEHETSYSGSGYYFKSEKHYNIGTAMFLKTSQISLTNIVSRIRF